MSAVNAKMPSWTCKRIVSLWEETSFKKKFLLPFLLEWEEKATGTEDESFVRETVFYYCINVLSRVLGNALSFDKTRYGTWERALRDLSTTFSMGVMRLQENRGLPIA